MRVKLRTVLLLAGALIGTHGASASPPFTVGGAAITPFADIGVIERFTLDSLAPNSGGVITMNGHDYTIPANTIVVMPGTLLSPLDLFKLNPKNPNVESGLALKDLIPPVASYEASLIGNIVNGRYIAGLVTIHQELLNVHQGYIKDINYATGELTIISDIRNAAPANADPTILFRVKLDDPAGRYGRKMLTEDPRFTVDIDNPTVTAETGYPMCIPRTGSATLASLGGVSTDPLCPASNRPLNPVVNPVSKTHLPLTRFVMDTVPLPPVVPGSVSIAGATDIPPCGAACDQTKQVPFMVGDYVTVNGTLSKDALGNQYISAWTIMASNGIYTKPGTLPSYIHIDVLEVGTIGAGVDGVLIEGQDRIKVVGSMTDPTKQVEIYAVGTDNVLRWIGNINPLRIPFGRYTLFVQKDILRFVAPVGAPLPIVTDHLGTQFGAPRQLMAHIAGTEAVIAKGLKRAKPVVAGTPPLNGAFVPTAPDFANGLVADQYVVPIPAYITPEAVQWGDPQVPVNFECFDFVVKGWLSGTPNTPTVGQLTPWPGGITTGALPPPASQAGVRCE